MAAMPIGSVGTIKVRVAAVSFDHASIGWLVSLIEPSISMRPGVGQKPVPPVLVRQHVAVVVQSLCVPVLLVVSVMIRVSCE